MSFPGGPTPQIPTAPSGQVIARFDSYAEAQRAVDHLSDKAFQVQAVSIIGSDLRMVERVTGRLTYSKVALSGLASGAWMGLFVGLLFLLFVDNGYQAMLSAVIVGGAFGLLFSVIPYSFSRGKRDFTSSSQIVASKYAVLCHDRLAGQAREILRAAGFPVVTGVGDIASPTTPTPGHPQQPMGTPWNNAGPRPPAGSHNHGSAGSNPTTTPTPPAPPNSGNPFAVPSQAPQAQQMPAAGTQETSAEPQQPKTPPTPHRDFVDEHGRPRYGVRLADIQTQESSHSAQQDGSTLEASAQAAPTSADTDEDAHASVNTETSEPNATAHTVDGDATKQG